MKTKTLVRIMLISFPFTLFPFLGNSALADISDGPIVRVKHLRFFWVDIAHPAGGESTVVPEPWLDGIVRRQPSNSGTLIRLLSEEIPGGWFRGEGRVLAVVPKAGSREERLALCSGFQDSNGRRQVRMDLVVGTRFTSELGTFTVVNQSRVRNLPRFARTTVMEMIDLRVQERQAYYEAAMGIQGLRCDEIRRVEAFGPSLIRLSKKWDRALKGYTRNPERSILQDDENAWLGIGPFRVHLPTLIRSLARGRSPRETRRVDVTNTLWPEDDSCGAMLVGRLLEYSVVTLRIKRRDKGPAGNRVMSLPSLRLQGFFDSVPTGELPFPDPPPTWEDFPGIRAGIPGNGTGLRRKMPARRPSRTLHALQCDPRLEPWMVYRDAFGRIVDLCPDPR